MPEVLAQVDKDDSLLSGRELSTLVCERIFDEPMPPVPEGCALFIDRVERSPKGAWLHVHIFEHGDQCEWIPRPFAEEVEAAMEVVEKMRELDQDAEVEIVSAANLWGCTFAADRMDGNGFQQLGQSYDVSLPECICRAALAAIEVKEK